MTETVQFILALGLLIGFAKAMGYLTYRLNQPAVLGELLAGVIIGPTLLNLLGIHAIFPDGESVTHTILEIAEIGVLLLMFMAGLEVDIQNMLHVGKPAMLAGVIGVIIPLVVITPAITLFGYPIENALFLGILLASMSTSITAQVMLELGVLQRLEGLTLLGAALIDDAVVILLLSIFLAVNPGGIVVGAEESASVLVVILRIVGFLVVGVAGKLVPAAATGELGEQPADLSRSADGGAGGGAAVERVSGDFRRNCGDHGRIHRRGMHPAGAA